MQLLYLEPDKAFPSLGQAMGPQDPVPGLLCAGADLSVPRLLDAYRQGIFPWFSEGQPILWWSPDPRMVLPVQDFRLHRSMRKTLQSWIADGRHEIRIDHDFATVIRACSETRRRHQRGTWIVPEMVDAYLELHRAGHAHSVETWCDGELMGGLYLVNIGRMVFGESMFSRSTDASKFALCALIAFARSHDIPLIDCQQNTGHLASLGAREIPRSQFIDHVQTRTSQPSPRWAFSPQNWACLLSPADAGSRNFS